MLALLGRYARWLHTGWPAGRVEPLPECDADGRTNVPGVFVCGDLTGVPLLKFALDSGVRAVRAIANEPRSEAPLIILGAGVSGMAAALEARRLGLACVVYEASEPFATLVNFPRHKPIFTYPAAMTPAGELRVAATVKDELLDELLTQTTGLEVQRGRAERIERRDGRLQVRFEDGATRAASHVLVAIGRSGDHRRLGVPGEELEKVTNRLHDAAEFRGRDVLVAGGGDSALEAAQALVRAGARVTLVHRGREFARARAENAAAVQELARAGRLDLRLETRVQAIHRADVELASVADGAPAERVANDAVLTLIGREAPVAFLRRSGVRLRGDSHPLAPVVLTAALVLLALLYDWKSNGFLEAQWARAAWPADVPQRLAGLGAWWAAQVADRATLLGTLAVSMKSRSFWYTLVYTTVIAWFGWQRVQRRRTPYVTRQTLTLFLVQALPLFLLPELLLPWLGYRGAFDHGAGRALADALFEPYVSAADLAARHWPDWGHPRAYWRAYGFILAWPLNVYNIFTHEPRWAWIGIGFVQTFVLIPLAVLRWGKGAYCGWICSCGALAETLGDTQRTKMPHGPGWNRVNFVGQVFLAAAFALLALRVAAWLMPGSGLGTAFDLLMEGKSASGHLVNPLSYKWVVDVLFGGVIGVGFYFKYSGRVWCRFACPLAALMHVYARFSRFAIVPEKPKCISCNVCTSVCHQGIDVMAFANRGLPMQDPQCVRCSACVHSCPTGVLQFGEVTSAGQIIRLDTLMASPVRAREAAGPPVPPSR